MNNKSFRQFIFGMMSVILLLQSTVPSIVAASELEITPELVTVKKISLDDQASDDQQVSVNVDAKIVNQEQEEQTATLTANDGVVINKVTPAT
ncbi:MAG: hypothetical protein ACK5MW_05085 [Enterococcus sp.]